MLELVALAGLLIAGFAVFAVFGMVFIVLKIALWAVFFPIRLLFKLLWIPFGLIGGLFSFAAGITLLPILLTVGFVVAVVAAIAALLALLVPAIPFVLLGLMIWAFMRQRPAAV
jgi:hypothetical protein